MQTIGPWKRLVVYLSKRLDLLAAGWPPCLCIIATTPLLIKDSDNWPWDKPLRTKPHAMREFLNTPHRWLTLDWLSTSSLELTQNSVATLLLDQDLDQLLHDCMDILSHLHQLDDSELKYVPLMRVEVTWFTDGSSFIKDGTRYAGAAGPTQGEVILVETILLRHPHKGLNW